MDKNTLIVLGFLLLCIVLSLDKKEGFVVVREDLFETECSVGHDSCTVFLSGQAGVECADPSNKNLYNIPSSGTSGRSKFTGSDFNMNPTSCSASAYENNDRLASQECVSEGEPYTLTGCSAYCIKPNVHPGYNIINPPDSIKPGSVQSVQTGDIVCADGYTPTIDTCVWKNSGLYVRGATEEFCTGRIGGESAVWFGKDDGIKIYCDQPGGTYNIIGCEESCYSRIDRIGDYLINTQEISEDDYNQNKERIETMDNRTSTSLGEKVVHDRFPYSESPSSIFASNDSFNVSLQANTGWIFSPGDGDTTEPCDPGEPDVQRRNKYFVNGLYPDCNSTIEECLNFNIVYNSETIDTPKTLEELKDKLPTENIFPQGSEPDKNTDEGLADLNKYKNALYYFRRFRNSDGKDEIEAQIRCDIDPTSDFHCSFTSNN